MESMGNALTQPFQGDRAGENTLRLAALLAPRLNFGNRPLQPGEGEGLKQLLGAFGELAGQQRKSQAESQVIAGLPDLLAGKTPSAPMPWGDISDSTLNHAFTAMARAEEARNPSAAARLALLPHLTQIYRGGGDPSEAMRILGMPRVLNTGVTTPSPPPGPTSIPPAVTGPVSMHGFNELAPSLVAPSVTTPSSPTTSPFAAFGSKFTNVGPRGAIFNETTGEEVYRNRGPEKVNKGQDLVFVGPDNKELSRIAGPVGIPQIHNIPAGGAGVVQNPDGTEAFRIMGPPAQVSGIEKTIQALPQNLQQPAREAITGLRPKAGEAVRAAETERRDLARENKPGTTKAPSQFRAIADTYKEMFDSLEPIEATPRNLWNADFGSNAQTTQQQAKKIIDGIRDDIEKRAASQAFREYFAPSRGTQPPNGGATQTAPRPPPLLSAPSAPTATGPNGQKLILRNGQWAPYNGR